MAMGGDGLATIVVTVLGIPAAPLVNVLADRVVATPGASGRPGKGRRGLVAVVLPALFALTGLRFGARWSLPAFIVLETGLIALAVADAEHLVLPKRLIHPCLVGVFTLLVVAAAGDDRWARLGQATAAGVATWAVFAAIHLARPADLGFGDVRLAGLLGLGLGWLSPILPAVGVFVGCVAAGMAWALLRVAGRVSRNTPLPFGTFLAVGAILAVLGSR